MSEKRFSETEKHCYHTSLVFDNQTQEELGTPKVVVLLNMFEDDVQIKDKKIDEQQATISQLEEELKLEQDFASRWQKESEMLAKENEQLRKELDNFKPVMFQDMRKGTVILYSKGDIDE